MADYVTWSTPMQVAERAIYNAGELLGDRKVNAAVLELMTANIAIAETIQFLMQRKK